MREGGGDGGEGACGVGVFACVRVREWGEGRRCAHQGHPRGSFSSRQAPQVVRLQGGRRYVQAVDAALDRPRPSFSPPTPPRPTPPPLWPGGAAR